MDAFYFYQILDMSCPVMSVTSHGLMDDVRLRSSQTRFIMLLVNWIPRAQIQVAFLLRDILFNAILSFKAIVLIVYILRLIQ